MFLSFFIKFHCNILCWDYLLFPSTSIPFVSCALNSLLSFFFFIFTVLLLVHLSRVEKKKKKINNFNENVITYCTTKYQSKQIGYTTFSLLGTPAILSKKAISLIWQIFCKLMLYFMLFSIYPICLLYFTNFAWSLTQNWLQRSVFIVQILFQLLKTYIFQTYM